MRNGEGQVPQGAGHKRQGWDERRLTRRVEKRWRASAGHRLLSWQEVRNLDFGGDWAFCFAVDLGLSSPDPYYIHLGERLCELGVLFYHQKGAPERAAVDLISGRFGEVSLGRQIIHFQDMVRLADGSRLVFRCMLGPLSDNGADVTHVFGAATGQMRR